MTTIGIDLGTTNSLCAVLRDGKPLCVANAHGEYLTPSVVGVLEDGRVVVGRAARELGILAPERTAACFKRLMGTERGMQLAGREYSPIELSSLVLGSLRADAEAFLGEPVTEAVITVPAYFNAPQREATKVAGELAGLEVRRILNEPSAAALCYGFDEPDADRRLMVFDLGGGTFDVTLLEVFEGSLEIVASAGESRLGGEDLTERLVAQVLRGMDLNLELAEMRTPKRVARLRSLCEEAKRRLGAQTSFEVKVPEEDGRWAEGGPGVELRASELDPLWAHLLGRLEAPMVKALRDAKWERASVDEVLLVGGASRTPAVRERVRAFFGNEPKLHDDPDRVVALGSALQAALVADDAAVEDLVMTDVCPFSLGVDIQRSLAGDSSGGYFLPILHRNTTLPCSREETVYTTEPNQRIVLVRVYQGEARKVSENVFLGEFEVHGIPPGPKGRAIALRFTYDLNGLLEVEAIVRGTGRKFQSLFTHNAKDLSPKEVERAAKKLQRLKVYPRDQLAHRELLLFAERAVAEVNPEARHELEAVLDMYETALGQADPKAFESARAGLLEALLLLGLPYQDADPEDPNGGEDIP